VTAVMKSSACRRFQGGGAVDRRRVVVDKRQDGVTEKESRKSRQSCDPIYIFLNGIGV
jgi:hypothetical protein